jgi:diguanylate cyclase (GGDEF)-like protein/putative nucleotidyltransferase with HDIG domain
MDQLSLWLLASLLLVSLSVYLFVHRLRKRLEAERKKTARTAELHVATMEALAFAIEAKDHTAHNHIRRVQVYSTGLARALGMSDVEVEAVKTAALLHDIGKLAVPEHILAKPGPLTPEEFQKVRIHSQIGAEILGAVPFPYPVAPLILNHHERWDGKGYPSGRREEQIPLGARVLGLAEYYDALTSDRPYHKAISAEAAEALVRQESGHAFDPRVLDTFLRILPRLREEAHKTDSETRSFSLPFGDAGATKSAARPKGRSRQTVFNEIAGAHREIYALYEIAQTMGTGLGVSDTMTLIASRLANLVPFSTCALFLHSEETDALHCQFATGIDAELVQPLVLKSGQGLTGWVARNRRPLVNALPSTDLEATGSTQVTALKSALVCPLLFGNSLIGTLAVYHTTESCYRDDHRRLLDRVCEQAGAVIHNAIVFEQTHEASLTDPLTGLPNTRFMFTHLSRELARAERLESEVSLLVLDLNDFKEINDTYGHQTGDRALRAVAHVLRTAIRPYDICVRYAGDEFIVVLAGCGRDEAEGKRVELVQAVDRLAFEARAGLHLSLSISAGAAVFPHDGDSYEALLTTADSRMYRDKADRKRDGSAASDPASDTLTAGNPHSH